MSHGYAERRAIARYYELREPVRSEERETVERTGGFRLHWRQAPVDHAQTGADERDLHGCQCCGELSGFHWIGCQVHIMDVFSRTPKRAAPKPLNPAETFPLSAAWWHG